jgi:hypothetical protein
MIKCSSYYLFIQSKSVEPEVKSSQPIAGEPNSNGVQKLTIENMNLQDPMEALNKLDVEDGKSANTSCDALRQKIKVLQNGDDNELVLTESRPADISFLLPYCKRKGLHFYKKSKDGNTTYIIVKDEEASSLLS